MGRAASLADVAVHVPERHHAAGRVTRRGYGAAAAAGGVRRGRRARGRGGAARQRRVEPRAGETHAGMRG